MPEAQEKAPLGERPEMDFAEISISETSKSSKCARCGRRLTDPESQRIGMGPVCWAKAGGIQRADASPEPDGQPAEGDGGGAGYVLFRLRGEAYAQVRDEDGRHEELRHVVRHSPDGFEWGYGGSGPADLAFAILADVAGEEIAEQHYQEFKWDVIAGVPRRGTIISRACVLDWLRRRGVEVE